MVLDRCARLVLTDGSGLANVDDFGPIVDRLSSGGPII